jgi:hypothetical protein
MLTNAKSWQEIVAILEPQKHQSDAGVTDLMVRNLYQLSTTQGWNRMTRDEQKQIIMNSVEGCTDSIADILVDCSIAKFEIANNVRAVPGSGKVSAAKAVSKIKSEDLDLVLVRIAENFGTGSFQNKDIAPFITEFSSRQIPSRLKKLVDAGKLQDLGGAPKTYALVQS